MYGMVIGQIGYVRADKGWYNMSIIRPWHLWADTYFLHH